MPYIIILIIIFLNYVIPYKGIVKLSENEEKILTQYKSFNSNSLSKMFSSKENAVSTALDDAPTLTVLGDLDNKKNSGTTAPISDKDFDDVDISKYL